MFSREAQFSVAEGRNFEILQLIQSTQCVILQHVFSSSFTFIQDVSADVIQTKPGRPVCTVFAFFDYSIVASQTDVTAATTDSLD